MSEPAQTLEGWYTLHDLRTMDWAAWKLLASDERQAAIHEFSQYLERAKCCSRTKRRQSCPLYDCRPKGRFYADDFASNNGRIE